MRARAAACPVSFPFPVLELDGTHPADQSRGHVKDGSELTRALTRAAGLWAPGPAQSWSLPFRPRCPALKPFSLALRPVEPGASDPGPRPRPVLLPSCGVPVCVLRGLRGPSQCELPSWLFSERVTCEWKPQALFMGPVGHRASVCGTRGVSGTWGVFGTWGICLWDTGHIFW